MLSKEFQFQAPRELGEALALLAEAGEGAKVLAGGMSLMPAMNLGLSRPDLVLSLNRLGSLDTVEETPESLRLGAMVRHARLAQDPLVLRHCPLLAEAAARIGDVQIRNRGTLGGSLAHADPAADYLPVALALGASVTLRSARGERRLQASEFFLDIMRTSLAPDELLVLVEVPKAPAGARSAYLRLARVEGSFAIISAACLLQNGRRVLALGGATPTPVLLDLGDLARSGSLAAEERSELEERAYEACAEAYGDLSGDAGYRRALARVFARRALEAALAR